MLKTSKTDTSERKVYIPGFVAQCLIDIKKEQDEVFHSLRHTSVTYKLNEQKEEENKITIPEGVDPELLMKVLGNPEMAALLTSLAKTMKV